MEEVQDVAKDELKNETGSEDIVKQESEEIKEEIKEDIMVNGDHITDQTTIQPQQNGDLNEIKKQDIVRDPDQKMEVDHTAEQKTEKLVNGLPNGDISDSDRPVISMEPQQKQQQPPPPKLESLAPTTTTPVFTSASLDTGNTSPAKPTSSNTSFRSIDSILSSTDASSTCTSSTRVNTPVTSGTPQPTTPVPLIQHSGPWFSLLPRLPCDDLSLTYSQQSHPGGFNSAGGYNGEGQAEEEGEEPQPIRLRE